MFGMSKEDFITGLHLGSDQEEERILKDLEGKTVIGWLVEYADYEGHAFIVVKDSKDWYCWSASHCSCNGFEDQWRGLDNYHPEVALKQKFSGYEEQDVARLKRNIRGVLEGTPLELVELEYGKRL